MTSARMLDPQKASQAVSDCGKAVVEVLQSYYPGCKGEEALAILTPMTAIFLQAMVVDGTFTSFERALAAFNTIMPGAKALVESASPTMAEAALHDSTSWGFDE
jgi:hypothetical protein